jgi:hypothetical protein
MAPQNANISHCKKFQNLSQIIWIFGFKYAIWQFGLVVRYLSWLCIYIVTYVILGRGNIVPSQVEEIPRWTFEMGDAGKVVFLQLASRKYLVHSYAQAMYVDCAKKL